MQLWCYQHPVLIHATGLEGVISLGTISESRTTIWPSLEMSKKRATIYLSRRPFHDNEIPKHDRPLIPCDLLRSSHGLLIVAKSSDYSHL